MQGRARVGKHSNKFVDLIVSLCCGPVKKKVNLAQGRLNIPSWPSHLLHVVSFKEYGGLEMVLKVRMIRWQLGWLVFEIPSSGKRKTQGCFQSYV